MTDIPAQTPYALFGGDRAIRALCARFYALMDTLPAAAPTRAVHPPSLANAEEKLVEYLTGWLGGPPLYTDKYGHPRLRMRHFGASIGRAEIEGWLLCFRQAWAETIGPSALADQIMERIEALAWHMGNQEEAPTST
jgi:hemoglobin